ncbi:MAG: glycerophosphodiester phosphodiesterase family protein [Syntrophales bacterium]|nr:glycerophosphodiester phosphodiesterase family protein [Syntrophales bacterium]
MALIIAHRGARSLAPENTLAAARTAREVDSDLWETDVTVTKGGGLVLLHDKSLARTTDVRDRFPDRGPWHCSDFTLDEVRSLDAGSWFMKTDPFGRIAAGEIGEEGLSAYRNEKVPTLREALQLTRDTSFPVNLELKRLPPALEGFPIVEQVLEMIDTLAVDQGLVSISSFHHEWLREVQRRTPSIAVQALIGDSEAGPPDWREPLEFGTYNVRSTLIDEGQIRLVTQRGISLNLFTVNETEDMLRFDRAGAAGLFTDFPQRAVKLLR